MLIAGRAFMLVWANKLPNPYDRAVALFNLGVRGNYSKTAIEAMWRK